MYTENIDFNWRKRSENSVYSVEFSIVYENFPHKSRLTLDEEKIAWSDELFPLYFISNLLWSLGTTVTSFWLLTRRQWKRIHNSIK